MCWDCPLGISVGGSEVLRASNGDLGYHGDLCIITTHINRFRKALETRRKDFSRPRSKSCALYVSSLTVLHLFLFFSSSRHALSFGYTLNCCWWWSQCATCKLFSFCSCMGGCDRWCPFLPYTTSCEETSIGACRVAWESRDVLDQFGTSSQEASLVLEVTRLCAGFFLQQVAMPWQVRVQPE